MGKSKGKNNQHVPTVKSKPGKRPACGVSTLEAELSAIGLRIQEVCNCSMVL